MEKLYEKFEDMVDSADPEKVEIWANACQEEFKKNPKGMKVMPLLKKHPKVAGFVSFLEKFQKLVDKYAKGR